jgi:hypothetical protein
VLFQPKLWRDASFLCGGPELDLALARGLKWIASQQAG